VINIFKENYINKLLTHTLILLISFLISYLIFSSTSSKSLKITKAFLVVHAPCNVLHYGSDLLALMDKFRKKSILINHKHNVQCEDFTLYKFDFTFKTIHKDYVKKEIKNYVLFNLENNEAIKTEIYEKIIANEKEIENLKVGLKLFDVDGLEYNKFERSWVAQDLKSSFGRFSRLNYLISDLQFKNRQLEKLLKFNGAKYDLNFLPIDKRNKFSYFNHIFIVIFFLTALLYFLFYLLLTILPKFKSDFK